MRYTAVTHIPSIAIKQGVVPEGAQITIAIPTYKRAQLLRETLESCLAQQTNSPFAIMVVDNNPERECETEQLLREYKAIPNLFYYKNTENIGMTGNWNKLFELAQTNFVVMLHDDDLLYNDYVEKVECILRKYNYDINALFLDIKVFSNYKNIPKRDSKKMTIKSIIPFDFSFGNSCAPTGVLIKRSVFINLDGFNDSYFPSSDYEMYVRLSYLGKTFKLFDYTLSLYRISENESMNSDTILRMSEKDKIITNDIVKSYPTLYKKLFYIYQKNRELLHFIGAKEVFKVNFPEINQKIRELKSKIIFFDKLIFLGWRVFIKLHFMLKPKTTIKL